MRQEDIPLNVNGHPDDDEISKKDFSHLPASTQAALARIAEIRAKRNGEHDAKPEFTSGQIAADARKHEAFHSPRQQD